MKISQTVEVSRITTEEVLVRIERGEPIVFIDARNEKDWNGSDVKLPGAVRVEAGRVGEHLAEIPKGRSILTYCTCPHEESGAKAAQELMQLGYEDVHALHGGLEAWKKGGGTLEHKPA